MSTSIKADDLIAAWPQATDAQKAAALAALRGEATIPADGGPFPSVMSAEQVARVTNLCPRSLRSYARKGLLRPAYYGGSSRAWGYHADSVRAFIENAKR